MGVITRLELSEIAEVQWNWDSAYRHAILRVSFCECPRINEHSQSVKMSHMIFCKYKVIIAVLIFFVCYYHRLVSFIGNTESDAELVCEAVITLGSFAHGRQCCICTWCMCIYMVYTRDLKYLRIRGCGIHPKASGA